MSSTIPTMKSTSKTSLNSHRRYLQVYAQCYCEINRLSGERKRGSCFAAYRGKISLVFDDNRQLHNFHPTKCLCQLDWITKTVWPCFPCKNFDFKQAKIFKTNYCQYIHGEVERGVLLVRPLISLIFCR